MITKQQKIDAIYEKIANKNLNFGCRVFHKVDGKRSFKARIITDKIEKDYGTFYGVKLDSENSVTWLQEKEMEIIGHPVMIGDVIDYITRSEDIDDERKYFINNFTFYNWQEKRKPIEEQDDECVDFIYDLIS